jgi:hypothetical protein
VLSEGPPVVWSAAFVGAWLFGTIKAFLLRRIDLNCAPVLHGDLYGAVLDLSDGPEDFV